MIECEVCKKTLSESEFHFNSSGGLPICIYCLNTDAGKEYIRKVKEKIAKANLKSEEEKEQEFFEQVDKYSKW